MLETLKVALILILYVALISLPGVAVTVVGWWLLNRVRPGFLRTFFRAGLLATAITPTIYGHAGRFQRSFLSSSLRVTNGWQESFPF